jgi:hypothetical protein
VATRESIVAGVVAPAAGSSAACEATPVAINIATATNIGFIPLLPDPPNDLAGLRILVEVIVQKLFQRRFFEIGWKHQVPIGRAQTAASAVCSPSAAGLLNFYLESTVDIESNCAHAAHPIAETNAPSTRRAP